MKTMHLALGLAIFSFVWTGPTWAQNTGGVFGPVVGEGDRPLFYVGSYDPDSHRFAQQLILGYALNGDFMVRGVIEGRKTADSDIDLDYVQGEVYWDLSEDGAPWRTGFRLDLRVRESHRAEQIGLNWMNQWTLPNGVTARFLIMSAVEVGDNARDGIFLQTRSSLYRRIGNGPRIGLELYNNYGSSDDFADFDDQRHQIGPAVAFSIGGTRGININPLFGLTDATPDTELRLWFSMKL